MPRRNPVRSRKLVSSRLVVPRIFKRKSTSKRTEKNAVVLPDERSLDKSVESTAEKDIHLEVQIDKIEFELDGSDTMQSTPDEHNFIVGTSVTSDDVASVVDLITDLREQSVDDLIETSASEESSRSKKGGDGGIAYSQAADADYSDAIDSPVSGLRIEDIKPGDFVQVVTSHKKHGEKQGRVYKITKKFVYFKTDALEEVHVMPKFLKYATLGSCTRNDEAALEESTNSNTNNQPAIAPAMLDENEPRVVMTFVVGDSVKVTRGTHRGKQGTVSKVTAKMVQVTDSGTNDQFKCMQSSLTHVSRIEAESVDDVASINDAVEMDCARESGVTARRPKMKLKRSIDKAISTSKATSKRKSISKIIAQPSSLPQRLERLVYGTSYVKDKCLLREMLSNDILVEEYELPMNKSLETVKVHFNRRYELYYSDVKDDPTKASTFKKPQKLVVHYVQTEDLRQLEESLADFGSLIPRKVWARRKLFLSTAAKVGYEYAIREVSDMDVVVHEISHTVGCGFIDEEYLVEMLGGNAAAKRTLGIQVRICIPTHGVFKGLLMRKRITSGPPIQLNESLRKIPASRSPNASGYGYMVMNRIFPSTSSLQVARLFSSYEGNSVTKTFRRAVKAEKECDFSVMHQRLITGLGVPKEVMNQYLKEYKTVDDDTLPNLHHTHMVGFADPTDELPPNSVFVPGVKQGDICVDKVFVSRAPALEPKDGRMIRVVTTKPYSMSQRNWDWLQTLHFGGLIFANPDVGHRPQPELIADGDLDGDLYFVCWDPVLLSHVNPLPMTAEDLKICSYDEKEKHSSYNDNWFEQAQEFVSNTGANIGDMNALVGILYNLSVYKNDTKADSKYRPRKSIHDPDAIAFAKAYKLALEFKKHGCKISLPSHLWEDIPPRFHRLLCSSGD